MSLKILIIRFSSIGDIVLTSPVIRALKNQLGAEIHYLTKPAFAAIPEANPAVTCVHRLQDDWKGMIAELKRESFDAVVDLHSNLRSFRVKQDLQVPSYNFRKLNLRKWFLVRLKWNILPDVHIVDRYFDAVKPLGVKPDTLGLDFPIPEKERVDVCDHFGLDPLTYTCIAVGAAHTTKCLTRDQLIEITNRITTPVILMGGPGDISKAEEIVHKSTNQNVKNACGKFSILESGSILQQALHILNFDSGLMHISSALQKEQIVVWGNTVPDFGMYPYYGNSESKAINFEVKGLSCRPCSKIGFEKCPKGHFKCMQDQPLQKIAEAISN